jgi:prevent-host-death family protein
MSLATQIKPISYLKGHAADIVKGFARNPESLIITQNGEARMVVMDIHEYEKQQETLALLQLLSMSNDDFDAGNAQDGEEFFNEMKLEEDEA